MEIKEQILVFLQKHKTQVWVFAITFVCGYLIHFYMFTNKFLNYFEMNNILTGMSFYKGDTVEQGKWFIPILSSVSTVYSMPAVNGIIGITFLSVFNLLVCDLLKIKGRFFGILTGLVIMTYPSVASYFSYGVNTDVLTIAPCMGVLSILIIEKSKEHQNNKQRFVGIGLGILLIGLTIGSYQPFFAIIIACVYTILFVRTAVEAESFEKTFKNICFYLIVLGLGFLTYYIGLQIAVAFTGVQLGDYHGVNEMASFTLKGIVKGFVYTYIYFFRYFFTLEYANYTLLVVTNVILSLLLIWMTCYQLMKRQKRRIKEMVTGFLLLVLLPLGTNASPFLMADRVGNGVDRYMMFSILFTYFLVICMMVSFPWNEAFKRVVTRHTVQWITTLAVLATVISGTYMCNQAYYRMETMTEQESALLNRVVGRMEEVEGWSKEIPVYFANCSNLFNDNYDVDIPQFETLTRMDGTKLEPWYNRSAIAKYMRVYLHFPVNEATEEQGKQLEQTEEYQQMGIYPAENSIQIINNVMVVKFNDKAD